MQLFILDYGWKDQSARGDAVDLSAPVLLLASGSHNHSTTESFIAQ